MKSFRCVAVLCDFLGASGCLATCLLFLMLIPSSAYAWDALGKVATVIFGPFIVVGVIVAIVFVAVIYVLALCNSRSANLVALLLVFLGGVFPWVVVYLAGPFALFVVLMLEGMQLVFLPALIVVGVCILLVMVGRRLLNRQRGKAALIDKPVLPIVVMVLLGIAILVGNTWHRISTEMFVYHKSFYQVVGEHLYGERFVYKKDTEFGMRWFPTHVRFGRDNDTVVVSLCHVRSSDFCRVGLYSVSKNHWVIVPYEENRTYRKPILSPDGKWIVANTVLCDEYLHCPLAKGSLDRVSVEGLVREKLADTPFKLYSPQLEQEFYRFSQDGRSLLYWGGPRGQHESAVELFRLDWDTQRETQLTALGGDWGDGGGTPYLLADGRLLFRTSSAYLYDKTLDRPMDKGAMFLVDISDIPIARDNHHKFAVLNSVHPLDMDHEGRLLHWDSLEKLRGGVIQLCRILGLPTLPTFLLSL